MILASRSPRRVELMRDAGYTFHVIPADIDETPLPREEPLSLVERLARTKAMSVATSAASGREIVLAADTVVIADGVALGKPKDEADARRMLARLSDRMHQVATGVCIALGANATGSEPALVSQEFTVVTDVVYYPLDQTEIDEYIASGEPFDKAGAYGIQGIGGRMLVKSISGDFYNVMGLPIAAVARHLKRLCDA
ncbi:Maf family protein [Coriobacterium glomerans]|uniref:Maf family protein n=1 Tax=Coriobacterium glomerans TaxID=33871 RepID=UPI0002DEBAD6|nr:Maf family protein [Coriobacterium glomerans]